MHADQTVTLSLIFKREFRIGQFPNPAQKFSFRETA